MPVPIRFKRGNFANLPALGPGEPAFTLDTNEFYVGLNSTTDGNKFLDRTDIGQEKLESLEVVSI